MLINLVKLPKTFKTINCNPGKKERPLYKYVYDEEYGCPRRVLNGHMDQQDFIQQAADDIDFKSIGKMLVDTRDNVVDHFRTTEGDIVDVTGMPRNVHEYQSLFNKMKKQFEGLPQDMKDLFANDFDKFHQAYKDGSYQSILDSYFKPVAAAPASEKGSEE